VRAPPGRPKALAPWGERRAAPIGGNTLAPGRPKALAPWGERRAAPSGGNIQAIGDEAQMKRANSHAVCPATRIAAG
jgi:hypothetical protein